MRIYFIRHGRQCDKRCNVDVALSEEGIHQAKLLGSRMKEFGVQKVYSSDMIRAKQTAEYANQYWNVEHEIIPEFREISFGKMEGKDDDEIQSLFADFKKEQEKMEYDLPYPDGESAMDVVKRSMPKLMEIVNSGLECVAIVTHGVWIRAMIAYILGMDMAKWRLLGVAFENGSITQVDYHSKKQIFTLEKLNDYAHLEAYKELLRSAWNVNEN